MGSRSRQYYLLSILVVFLFHGTLLMFTTEQTYDAYVHMFFADHYAGNWFDTWSYKWYGGFTTTSYPPMVHQGIALLSKIVSLKAAFMIWALGVLCLMVRGVYHFSKIWLSEIQASYAAILTVLSSSITEALHVFGQLPSLTGVALLLNVCPLIYHWLLKGSYLRFLAIISLLVCITSAHHVTTIFGMVFFIFPVIGTALIDVRKDFGDISFASKISSFFSALWIKMPQLILLGLASLIVVVLAIFPYWYWSLTDPINQVSIPHGSRESFILEPNLGIVFFLIPWGAMLFFLPGILMKIFKTRSIFLALSFCLLFILGTGGTTPIPRFILGDNAFEILTLDRFSFWASIIALPFFAQLIYSLFEGSTSQALVKKLGLVGHRVVCFGISFLMIGSVFFIINLSNFRSLQPEKIDMEPIVNFLDRDGHERWRYLTLGFGDQMAFLSAQTDALTIDGNYHSVRRLPEMTTRAVERLENAKYLGIQGIGSLQQFLGYPEKYHLKYVFNNDKFYEPLLYFAGWSRLKPLENGITIWERKDVPPLPAILPRKNIPRWQQLLWSFLPMSAILLALVFNWRFLFAKDNIDEQNVRVEPNGSTIKYGIYLFWFFAIVLFYCFFVYSIFQSKNPHGDPQTLIESYFHELDFKQYEKVYDLLNPKTRPVKEQFDLERSVQDGILASFAKLNSIKDLKIEKYEEGRCKAFVKTEWLTSVDQYEMDYVFDLLKLDGKWYVEYTSSDKEIAVDQFFRLPEIDFLNQGRREALIGKTRHEDILDRPEVYITQSNLVAKDSTLHVVGEVLNMDNDPAYINIQAQLFKDGELVANYAVDQVFTHHLLPKERSLFRVDFQELLLENIATEIPEKFDPNFSIEKHWDRNNIEFRVLVFSTVSDDPFYRYHGLSEVMNEGNRMLGTFVNYGNHEVSIPSILIGQYEGSKLMWVEKSYLSDAVKPQRSADFNIKIQNIEKIQLQKSGDHSNVFINGVDPLLMLKSFDGEFLYDPSKSDFRIKTRENRSIDLIPYGFVSF